MTLREQARQRRAVVTRFERATLAHLVSDGGDGHKTVYASELAEVLYPDRYRLQLTPKEARKRADVLLRRLERDGLLASELVRTTRRAGAVRALSGHGRRLYWLTPAGLAQARAPRALGCDGCGSTDCPECDPEGRFK